MPDKEAFLAAFKWGFLSFATGTLINLSFMTIPGGFYIFNIISIIVCAMIGLICGISIYRIRTMQE